MAPNETAREDISNGLTVLNFIIPDVVVEGEIIVPCALKDLQAIRARLESALAKLDATTAEERAIGRREQELGIMQDRAAYIAREFPPLDYPVAEDRAFPGQQVDEDGE